MIPRRDPLNGFEKFNGGFNVLDKHYWSSIFYLGIWGYALAFICLVFGIVALAWHFCRCVRLKRTWRKGLYVHYEEVKHFQLICVLQFTVVALISAALVFWGSKSVNKELVETSRILVTTSNDVLHQVRGALNTLEGATFPMEDPMVVDQIQSGCKRLNESSQIFSQKLDFAKVKVHMSVEILNLTMTLTASAITCIVLAGFVTTMKTHRGLLILLFGLVALLLVASWFLSGLSFVLYSITGDACQAMKEYNKDHKDSSLSKLLPCLEPAQATRDLDGARDAVKTLLGQANRIIGLVNIQEEVILLREASAPQYIPVMPYICDPYGPAPDYALSKCSSGTTEVQNFTKVFSTYKCSNDNVTYCFENKTPIPNQIFWDVSQAMNATSDIIIVLPKLYDIMTCEFISVAFEELTMKHCDPLKTGISALWIGYTIASVAMLCLQIMWLIICRTKVIDTLSHHRFTSKKLNSLP